MSRRGSPTVRLCAEIFLVQDQAHLPNERISLLNLRKGKSVVERFLSAVGGM